MAVTKEDIQGFIKEKGGAADDFVIRTTAEETLYLDNFKASEVEKAIDPKIKEVHSKYDDYIFDVTGLKKNAGEKTFDFVKRIAADLKGKADKLPEFEQEISGLKEKVGKNADAKLLADLESTKSAFASFKTLKEKELDDLRKETDLSTRRAIIEAEVNSFEFDPSIKEPVLKVYKDTIVNTLLQKSETRDAKLVFLDDNGNPLRNQAKNLAEYTANEIIAERMRDVIKQKRNIPGPPAPGDPKQSPKAIPDGIKTKVELATHLMKEGYKRNTKEYDEIYSELGAELPLE